MELNAVHTIHMLGIGGIGMSALARFLHARGKAVSGYDRTATPLTAALAAEGIGVYYEEDAARIQGADMVVYTPAVPRSHPAFAAAEAAGIPLLKRAEVLGMISRAYQTVAVAGTHGKTSTTGLVTHLLRSCGIDCTGFVGGITNNYESNYVEGGSDWMVVEADEFDRSFLQLSPDVAIITSMDADHLDIYGEEDAVKESFMAFAERLKPGGTLFLHHSLPEIRLDQNRRVWRYGMDGGSFRSENMLNVGLGMQFDYRSPAAEIPGMRMNMPGVYNAENATAAISVAVALGGAAEDIRQGLDTFTGIRRRFDIRLRKEDLVHVDDYAHHPSEIRAVLSAVRGMLPQHKLIVVFQPHLYSRTRDFHEGFAESLSAADAVILLDIYPAREEPMPGVSSQMVFDLLEVREKVLTDLEGMEAALEKMKSKPAVVMTLGAGNIDQKVGAASAVLSRW